MGQEIDLLANYPRTKRDVKERGATKTEEDRMIARQFGKDFFDGDRKHGYGGFNYHPRFWQPVIPDFQKHFNLAPSDKILDVGCGKGFMLYDFTQVIPGIETTGIDISSYAIENAHSPIKPHLQVGDARNLKFQDKTFDLVISINTIHNLEKEELAQSLCEIQRVSKGKSFITVDAYRNAQEKEAMYAWNLTAKTIMHVDEWKAFFKQVGYTGDYYWFVP
jgi:SAM-dependent methyltransferase